MENRSVAFFDRGFNCAQSVFTPFAVEHGIDEKLALQISAAFGGGINEGSICGAVIGAGMVIGLKYGMDAEENINAKEKTAKVLATFKEKFINNFNTIYCSELLGVEMSNSQLKKKAREQGLFRTKCPVYVKNAASILKEIVEAK